MIIESENYWSLPFVILLQLIEGLDFKFKRNKQNIFDITDID